MVASPSRPHFQSKAPPKTLPRGRQPSPPLRATARATPPRGAKAPQEPLRGAKAPHEPLRGAKAPHEPPPRRQSAAAETVLAQGRPKRPPPSLPRGTKAPQEPPPRYPSAPRATPRRQGAPRATPRRQGAAAETVLAQGRPKRRPKLTLPLCPRRPPAGASPRRQYGLCADVVRRRSPMPLGHPTGAASYPAPPYPLLQRLHPAGSLPSPPTFPRRPTPLKPPAPYPAPAHPLLQRLHPAG